MCNSNSLKCPEISFHSFPKESDTVKLKTDLGSYEIVSRRQVWVNKLRILKKINSHMRVCSLHFVQDDFFRGTEFRVSRRKIVKKIAIPSVNLPIPINRFITLRETSNYSQYKHLTVRNQLKEKIVKPIIEAFNHDCEEEGTAMKCLSGDELKAANTLLSLMQVATPIYDKKTFRNFFLEVNNTCNELTLCDFITSDSVLSSLTGLNSQILLHEIISSVRLVYKKKCVFQSTIYQRVILTFVKLKWNLSYVILGIFFGLTPRLCKQYIIDMIKILSSVLKSVIELPSMNEIRQNMPVCFEDFLDAQVVLNSTEIYTQIPQCSCCRIRFYSPSKSAQTVKFITGVSPAGLITFVSKPYGGQASAKIIFEDSNLIDKLEKNSAIMVDTDFLIDNICAAHNIKLYRPRNPQSKEELDENELEYNTNIAAARAHIDQVNEQLKIFKILTDPLSYRFVHCVEDIFIIICAVTNLSPSVLANDKLKK